MKRYESYKDSGVKWLGEIPSHWEVKRLRAALSERKERFNSAESLMILSLIKDKGIIPYDEKGEVGNKSKDDHTQYKVARKGDLVINSMNVIIGSLGITPYDGYISPAYYAFKPNNNIFLSYYNYILSLRKVQQSIRCFSKGIMEIRLKISAYDFLSMPFPFPTIKEQEAIANYLDAATSKIDEAIAQQQKMIDLLNERKQIIINNAVTKGLDPNVKMKPSGIDWIGDIPEHWEMRKARLCIIINNGSDPKQKGDIPVYGSGAESFRTCGEYKEGPCVLLGRKGATLHIPHYIEGRYWNVDTAFDVKTKNGMSLRYYYYLATCFDYPYYMSQTTLPSMTSFDYNRMKLPTPPENEQVDIVKLLDVKNKKTEELIECHKRLISLLQERKQIIINDVVTGKVKVV